jgi:hypothetical protein
MRHLTEIGRLAHHANFQALQAIRFLLGGGNQKLKFQFSV